MDKLKEIFENEKWNDPRTSYAGNKTCFQVNDMSVNENRYARQLHNQSIDRIEEAVKHRINDLKRATKMMEETIFSQAKSLKWHEEQWKIMQEVKIAQMHEELQRCRSASSYETGQVNNDPT